MSKGFFFSLDGLDGCGKSTQVRRLESRLKKMGKQVVTCADPGGTAIGKQLRQILLHGEPRPGTRCQALLFMASRAQLVDEIIQPALAAGKIVLADRFLLANVVYQGHASGLDPDLLWQTGKLSTGGILPSLTFVLDIPVPLARKRTGSPSDNMESLPDSFFAKVRQGFLLEAKNQPESILVVDGWRGEAEVEEEIFSHIGPMVAAGDLC